MSARDPCSPRPLPVVPGPAKEPAPTPRFHPGRWRAGVLIGLHLLFVVHLVHWKLAGETLSPLEPSEAMELVSKGALNAGALFFGLLLLSTLVLGRWFCGWACHVVALQDASRALLLKLGITPRPLRSRALALVPLFAFAYMFLLPLGERLLFDPRPMSVEAHLTTERFWATFPGWPVALLTFFVCGFLAVLFLGAKGFCTYGCPYGAAFSLLDRLAPARIRVSDACNSCGQCTAVCSSNVVVHAEVRDWGMVVDPGCMKCLDCVSSCPTGALSYGFGAPAVLRRPTERAAPVGRPAAFRRGEELFLGLAFLAAFLAWRGLYRQVPFLLSLGLGALLAWSWLHAWRLARGKSTKLLGWQLRSDDRLTVRGWLVLLATLFGLGLTAHAGALQLLGWRARADHEATLHGAPTWLQQLHQPVPLRPEQRAAIEAAVERERLIGSLSLLPDPEKEQRLAWLALLLGDEATCEAAARRALELVPDSIPLHCRWSEWLVARGRADDALAVLRSAPPGPAQDVAEATSARELLERALAARARAGAALKEGRGPEALAALEEALAARPDLRVARAELAELLLQAGAHARARQECARLLPAAPDDPELHRVAGLAALGQGDRAAAEQHFERSLRARRDPQVLVALAFLLDKRGEAARAQELLAEAKRLESPR